MDQLTRARQALARKRARSTNLDYSGPIPEWPSADQEFPEDELIYVAVNRERAGVVEVLDSNGYPTGLPRAQEQTVADIRAAYAAVNRWWWSLPADKRFSLRVPSVGEP